MGDTPWIIKSGEVMVGFARLRGRAPDRLRPLGGFRRNFESSFCVTEPIA